jgi:hypothetical protein
MQSDLFRKKNSVEIAASNKKTSDLNSRGKVFNNGVWLFGVPALAGFRRRPAEAGTPNLMRSAAPFLSFNPILPEAQLILIIF